MAEKEHPDQAKEEPIPTASINLPDLSFSLGKILGDMSKKKPATANVVQSEPPPLAMPVLKLPDVLVPASPVLNLSIPLPMVNS